MPLLLFVMFVVLPIAEIAVFIEAGRTIGIPATILITLGTAFLGSFLVRSQGIATLNRFMQSAERGEMPIEPVIDGMGIVAAGILLATPGFVTDLLGLALFFPPFRRTVVKAIFLRFLRNAHVQFRYYGNGNKQGGPRPGPSRPNPGPRDGKLHKSDNVIDADFETIAPAKSKGANGSNGKDDPASPWKKG